MDAIATKLSTLAAGINAEHAAAAKAATSAIEHARRCGEMLIEVKAAIGHGGFLSWLKANCEVGARQAQIYMRLAKCAPGSYLSIKEAARLTHSDPGDMPELSESHVLRCIGKDDTLAIVIPIGGRYFYVGVTADGHSVIDELPRGIRDDAVPQALNKIGFKPAGQWDRRPLSGDDLQFITDMRSHWAAKRRNGNITN